jgi:hypothetical protein
VLQAVGFLVVRPKANYCKHQDALGKFSRHEAALMNAFTKTLQVLHFIQSQRPAEDDPLIDAVATGNERRWWQEHKIDPLLVAERLWPKAAERNGRLRLPDKFQGPWEKSLSRPSNLQTEAGHRSLARQTWD